MRDLCQARDVEEAKLRRKVLAPHIAEGLLATQFPPQYQRAARVIACMFHELTWAQAREAESKGWPYAEYGRLKLCERVDMEPDELDRAAAQEAAVAAQLEVGACQTDFTDHKDRMRAGFLLYEAAHVEHGVELTAEEMQFCDSQRIRYDTYAAELAAERS